MKRLMCFFTVLIALTAIIVVYVDGNYPDNIMEICLKSYRPPDEAAEALEQTGAYDFVILYELFDEEGSAIVYKGNINIVAGGKIKDGTNLTFRENELIMGERYARENYSYYPLGQIHEWGGKEYRIDAIMSGSGDLYYGDLTKLENTNIKRQIVYAALKDEEGRKIDENIFIKKLGAEGIEVSSYMYCGDIGKFLGRIMIIFAAILAVCVLVISGRALKRHVSVLAGGYGEEKYDTTVRSYLIKPCSRKEIRKAVASLAGIALSLFALMLLTVGYTNLRMPYRLNPVSPRSIYGVIGSFFRFMAYYLKSGMTDISMLMLKIAAVYTAAVFAACWVLLITRKR